MEFSRFAQRFVLFAAVTAAPLLIGCGGSGGSTAVLSRAKTVTPASAANQAIALTRFDVNAATGKVTLSRLDPSTGRAIVTGGAVSFASSDLLSVGGDAGTRVLNISVTDNTNEGPMTNSRMVIGNLSNSSLGVLSSSVNVTTLAGSGAIGSQDGLGTVASFKHPVGIANGRGPSVGSLFVSDTANNTIRRIAADGTVSTIAGVAGSSGTTDGSGANARFNAPQQIALDSSGNIYVADSGNNTIRRITPQGSVNTIAGTGQPGNNDAEADQATFATPVGIAVSADGTNIIVSELNDLRLILYTAGATNLATSYTTETIAGSATPGFTDTSAGPPAFSRPYGIYWNTPTDELFVADMNNNAIRRVVHPTSGANIVSTLAGTSGTAGSTDGVGNTALLTSPLGISAINANNSAYPMLFISDASSVRMITESGSDPLDAGNYLVTSLAVGTGYADGNGATAKFSTPACIAAVVATGPSATLSIADEINNRIRQMTVANPALQSGSVASNGAEAVRLMNGDVELPNQLNSTVAWAKNLTAGGAQLQFFIPQGVSGFSFTAYIEEDTSIINLPAVGASMVTTIVGDSIAGAGNGPGKIAELAQPTGVCELPASAAGKYGANLRCFIADTFNNRIRTVDVNGVTATLIGGQAGFADGGITAAQFSRPTGIAAGPDGALYVTDANNHVVRRINIVSNTVSVTTIAGQPSTANSTDGAGNVATFNQPTGISVDAGGIIYVTDVAAHVVRRITYQGGDPTQASSYNVYTLAGTANSPGNADGLTPKFNAPAGIVADTDGKVYVADTGNDAIRVLTRVGFNAVSASTLAGSKGISGFQDGTGPSALFAAPMGVAVDTAHNLYVADSGSNRIRRVSPLGATVTLAGSTAGLADGSPGKFNSPRGVFVEAFGTLMVTDYNNHCLRTVQRVISTAQTQPNLTP